VRKEKEDDKGGIGLEKQTENGLRERREREREEDDK
jgi:hypothetical protein